MKMYKLTALIEWATDKWFLLLGKIATKCKLPGLADYIKYRKLYKLIPSYYTPSLRDIWTNTDSLQPRQKINLTTLKNVYNHFTYLYSGSPWTSPTVVELAIKSSDFIMQRLQEIKLFSVQPMTSPVSLVYNTERYYTDEETKKLTATKAKMTVDITSFAVEAKSMKVTEMNLTQEFIDDVIYSALPKKFKDEVTLEMARSIMEMTLRGIIKVIIDTLREKAKTKTVKYATASPFHEVMLHELGKDTDPVNKQANVIVLSPDLLQKLERNNVLIKNTREYHSHFKLDGCLTFCGTIGGNIFVYSSPLLNPNESIATYCGESSMDAAIILAPYTPVTMGGIVKIEAIEFDYVLPLTTRFGLHTDFINQYTTLYTFQESIENFGNFENPEIPQLLSGLPVEPTPTPKKEMPKKPKSVTKKRVKKVAVKSSAKKRREVPLKTNKRKKAK